MSAKINNLRNLRKRDFDIIKELSLLGAHMMNQSKNGLPPEHREALYNLLSRCGNEIIDEDGNTEYNYNLDFELIDRYEEISFWISLSKKLAARDTLRELGQQVNEGNFKKYERIRKEYEDEYLEKFNIAKHRTSLDDELINFDDVLLPY